MTRPAALLFDLDGTLIDSLPDIRAALNRTLADLGRRPLSLAEAGRVLGDGVASLVERALAATGGLPADAGALERAVALYRARYLGGLLGQTCLYPGVAGTLAELVAAGHVLAVCTNKPEAPARTILDGLGLGGLIPVVIGGDSLPERKPSPEPLRAALRRLGREGGPAAMVGDSVNDMLSARACGLPTVLVRYGYAPGRPEDLGADVIIDDFAELPGALAALGLSACDR